MHRIALAVIIATISLPFLASGQITYDGCTDIRGIPVVSISDTRVNDIAQASVDGSGVPIIRYNPQIVGNTRPQTRLFFYTHECGHHALGHALSGLRMGQEQEADCWSIRTLVDKSLVSESDITRIQGDLALFSRGDWTHLPGPQRAINLRACLDRSGSSGSDGPRYETIIVQCTHVAHPRGDLGPCTHGLLHARGDLVPCSHTCPGPYGLVPCHQADVVPCTHVVHPLGDLTPCTHLLHPEGDEVRQRVR